MADFHYGKRKVDVGEEGSTKVEASLILAENILGLNMPAFAWVILK